MNEHEPVIIRERGKATRTYQKVGHITITTFGERLYVSVFNGRIVRCARAATASEAAMRLKLKKDELLFLHVP